METYVSEMIDSENINWFPLFKAMTLKNKDEVSDNIDQQVLSMMNRVEKIRQKFNP